jgi:hypothetical protein
MIEWISTDGDTGIRTKGIDGRHHRRAQVLSGDLIMTDQPDRLKGQLLARQIGCQPADLTPEQWLGKALAADEDARAELAGGFTHAAAMRFEDSRRYLDAGEMAEKWPGVYYR